MSKRQHSDFIDLTQEHSFILPSDLWPLITNYLPKWDTLTMYRLLRTCHAMEKWLEPTLRPWLVEIAAVNRYKMLIQGSVVNLASEEPGEIKIWLRWLAAHCGFDQASALVNFSLKHSPLLFNFSLLSLARERALLLYSRKNGLYEDDSLIVDKERLWCQSRFLQLVWLEKKDRSIVKLVKEEGVASVSDEKLKKLWVERVARQGIALNELDMRLLCDTRGNPHWEEAVQFHLTNGQAAEPALPLDSLLSSLVYNGSHIQMPHMQSFRERLFIYEGEEENIHRAIWMDRRTGKHLESVASRLRFYKNKKS
jgi:hypothetical protein